MIFSGAMTDMTFISLFPVPIGGDMENVSLTSSQLQPSPNYSLLTRFSSFLFLL